jgi:hypothetical protein
VDVPAEANYTTRLEDAGIGLSHDRLRRDQKLTEDDIVTYLAHSRVTEQRASGQMQTLLNCCQGRPDIRRAVRMISGDEDNHLAYCHEELLRLASGGHAEFIRRTLRQAARAEIAIHRDVSKAVMAHLGRILGWSRAKYAALAAGIQAVYIYERLGGWRPMVSLRMPERRNAMGDPAPARQTYSQRATPSPASATLRAGAGPRPSSVRDNLTLPAPAAGRCAACRASPGVTVSARRSGPRRCAGSLP